MQTIEIEREIEFEKMVLLCIYWTARKTTTVEGCGPLYIKKISTPNSTHTQSPNSMLKITPSIINDIQENMGNYKHFNIEMGLGKEELTANFYNKKFSINASKNRELEFEIKDELIKQFEKEYPILCPHFLKKIYIPWKNLIKQKREKDRELNSLKHFIQFFFRLWFG